MEINKNISDQKALLVVVDMVNGFVKKGNMADISINDCTKNIVELIEKFIEEDNYLLAFNDNHQLGCKEFNTFPIHCVDNTEESQLVDEIKIYEDKIKVIKKNCTNGFMSKEYLPYFNSLKNLSNIVVVGCCTDICVLQYCLAMQTYINEFDLDVSITCYKDCMDTYNSDIHCKSEYNQMAHKLMSNAGIIVKDSYIGE